MTHVRVSPRPLKKFRGFFCTKFFITTILVYFWVTNLLTMGTNFYRIPTHDEMVARKETLIRFVNALELSPADIESGFRLTTPSKDWEQLSPWDMFLQDTNIHVGKRSHGWKFCWNFHKNKYYSDKESLVAFIRSGRIVDEYGEEQDVEDFITMALEWGQPDGLIVNEEYRNKERMRGHGSYWSDNEKYDDMIIDGLRVSKAIDFC